MSVCLHFSYGRPNERKGRINKSWLRPLGSPLRFMTAAAASSSSIFPPVQDLTLSPAAHITARPSPSPPSPPTPTVLQLPAGLELRSRTRTISWWQHWRRREPTAARRRPDRGGGRRSLAVRQEAISRTRVVRPLLSGCDLNVSDVQWGGRNR